MIPATVVGCVEVLESVLWPDGPRCPECGSGERVGRGWTAGGRRVWRCHVCGRPYTVLTGTPMEGSRLDLRAWLWLAAHGPLQAHVRSGCPYEVKRESLNRAWPELVAWAPWRQLRDRVKDVDRWEESNKKVLAWYLSRIDWSGSGRAAAAPAKPSVGSDFGF